MVVYSFKTQHPEARHSSKEEIFFRYAEGTKSHKIWERALRNVDVSRDVTFDAFCDENHGNVNDSGVGNYNSYDTVNIGINLPQSTEVFDSATAEPAEPEAVNDLQKIQDEIENAAEISDEECDSNDKCHDETTSQEVQYQTRRSSQVRKPPDYWWKAMVTAGPLAHAHGTTEIPSSYKQAGSGPNDSFSQKGIHTELHNIWTKLGNFSSVLKHRTF